MERLGESYEWGSAIRRLIELGGWTIHDPVPAFAGDGQLFILTKRGVDGRDLELKAVGETWADVSVDLFARSRDTFPPSPAPLHHTPVARTAAAAIDEGPTEDVQLQLRVIE